MRYFLQPCLPAAQAAPVMNPVLGETTWSTRRRGAARLAFEQQQEPQQQEQQPPQQQEEQQGEPRCLPAPPGCRTYPAGGFRDSVHIQEYRALRLIQRAPGLLWPSMAVHYSLLPKIVTPALALICWLVSLPAGASLITFVCAQDLINTAIKWGVQRPRPRWYDPNAGLLAKCGAWEVDLSFPSAHTQFFSGLAFCACSLAGWPVLPAALFGAAIGLTRNYLSVHWPTDTIAGAAVGAGLGAAWGRADPYAALVRAGQPMLSLGAATGLTVALMALMLAVRLAVPPIDETTRDAWYTNAIASLPAAERSSVLRERSLLLQPRSLRSKVPMLTTVWCALALTAAYPALLPSAMAEPGGTMSYRLATAAIGFGGLVGVDLLKRAVGRLLCAVHGGAPTDTAPTDAALQPDALDQMSGFKVALKSLTYAGICAWTFGLSQLLSRRVLGT